MSDIDYGLLAYQVPVAVFTHEARLVESTVSETALGELLPYKDIKTCALKLNNIKIKGEFLSQVPVEDTACCFQANKMDIFCLQEKHCRGLTL